MESKELMLNNHRIRLSNLVLTLSRYTRGQAKLSLFD